MAAVIRGEVLLFDPTPQAVYSEVDKCYRFYYSYKTYIPINLLTQQIGTNGIQTSGAVLIDANALKTEIWIPVYSPALTFADRSLIHLHGRVLTPIIDPNDEQPVFTLFIEVIFAQLQSVMHHALPSLSLSLRHIRPELTVIGKILDLSPRNAVADKCLTILIEAKDSVGNGVEIFRVG